MTLKRLVTSLCLLCCLTANADDGWVDLTPYFITNPTFDVDDAGWTATYNIGTHTNRAGTSEFWNGTFDFYQTVKDLPEGHYRLSLQGLFRVMDNYQGYQNYLDGTENITGMMYAGENKQKLKSVYSWSSDHYFYSGCWGAYDGTYYPNTMESANAAFEQGAYWNQMEFDFDGGDLNIGLSNDGFYSNNWCIFDNFKLEFQGDFVAVSSITMPSSMTLTVGASKTIEAVYEPEYALIKAANWKSSDEKVATVDNHGTVTAVGEGSCMITATAGDGQGAAASCVVTVERNEAKAGDLIINEVMAANVDQFISPAFNFDSWIELYNPTTKDVSLGDLYISDDKSNLQKWHTPTALGVVPAGGFKTLWFDSNPICPTNAPFKLDVDGGDIYISSAAGIIAEATYPEAMERVSYARTQDGGDTWQATATPTPGATNATAEFATEQLDAPVIDTPSRLFSGSIEASVTIPEGTTLRYTTDGTLPTLSNGETSADGHFNISSTTNLRLRLFQAGMLASRVTTRSYIQTETSYNLPILSVVSDPDFLYDDSIGVLVRGKNGRAGNGQSSKCNWNMDWERPVNMSYITKDGEMVLNQDVNLEMAGGWSRAYTPHSFKLKGSKEFGGDKNLPYAFFTAKPYIRNRTLQVRNGGNDNSCRFKDPALQTIIQTSGVDIETQSYQPVHEFINGQYIGVLNVREPNNKHYAYANYGWDDDEIDQFEMSPDSGYCQKAGTEEAYDLLYTLSANAADDATYKEICNVLDIDEYTNYMAMEFYLGGMDWPQNNVKGFRYHDDGKFRFVTFDLDGAVGSSDPFNNFAGKQTYTFDRLYDQPQEHITQEIKMVTIFLNLLQNEGFKKRFIDTYCLMGGSVFEASRCKEIIDSLTDIVEPEMQINNESPASTANSLKNGLNSRLSTAINAIQNYSTFGLSTVTPQAAQLTSDVDGATLYIDDIEVPTGRFNGKLFAPATLKAEAPAGYTFAGWVNKNESMQTLFPQGSQWSYYDKGSLDGQAWKNGGQTSWSSGKAPLGYSKDGLNTTISYGTDSYNKYPTYYFTRNVTIGKTPATTDEFVLNYKVDDGFIVYVNGTEAGRYNMPSGTVDFNTYSTTYASGNPDEGTMELKASLFRKGTNTIAVEVHNNAATSSDIYWDASLSTNMDGTGSTSVYSTDPVIDMPEGDFNLVATFTPMPNAIDSGYTPVRINEISADNEVYVSDYQKKSDWIELYNTTAEEQDVEGMYLTNDMTNLQKATISKGETQANTVIPAHGYLVVWCDKKDNLRDLHAPFKLDNDGGTVALSAADMSWTDAVKYPAHDGWHTVGRYVDGSDSLYLMNQPTIGKKNRLTSYDTKVKNEVVTGVGHVAAPASSPLTINYASGTLILRGEVASAVVDVYTLSGQKVTTARVNLNSGLGVLRLSSIAPGCYIARSGKAVCKFVR